MMIVPTGFRNMTRAEQYPRASTCAGYTPCLGLGNPDATSADRNRSFAVMANDYELFLSNQEMR